jgi:hypothetical protein
MQWTRHASPGAPFGFLVLAQFRKKCLSGTLPSAQCVARALIAPKAGFGPALDVRKQFFFEKKNQKTFEL